MIETLVMLAIAAKVIVELSIVTAMVYCFSHYGAGSLLPWLAFFFGGIVISLLNIEELDK